MKCGSCRISTADIYKKINDDDDLLEILKTLNVQRVYNPKYNYFCERCVQLATVKLSQRVTTISSQNANSFTVNSDSTGQNGSESSKDEFDEIVASKRVFSDKGTPLVIPRSRTKRPPGDVKAKPCPKRFKKPLAPVQLKTIAETSSSGQHKSTVAQPNISPQDGQLSDQESSGSLSADDMIIEGFENNVESEERPISSWRENTDLSPNNSLVVQTVAGTPTGRLRNNSDSSSNNSAEEPTVASGTRRSRRNTTPSSNNSHKEPTVASKTTRRSRRNTDSSSNSSLEEQHIANTGAKRLQRGKDSFSNKDKANKDGLVASHSRSDENASDRTTRASNQHARPNKGISTTSPCRAEKSPNDNQRSGTTSDANAVNSGTLAPAPKAPRIRQPNADIARNLQNYFAANVNVNNYARSLAG